MSRPSPVLDSVRGWLKAQPMFTIHTPTQMVRDLDKAGIKASSGATSMVLQEFVKAGLAERVGSLGSSARRGAYKLLPPKPIQTLLTSAGSLFGPGVQSLPPEQREVLNALKRQADAAAATYEAFKALFVSSALKRKHA